MTVRPILFSAPMVRALLDGRKTMTRRALKPQPPREEDFRGSVFGLCPAVADGVKMWSQNDYGRLPKHPTKWDLVGSVGVARDAGFPKVYDARFAVGDRLWVRETHAIRSWDEDGTFWFTYEADGARSAPVEMPEEFHERLSDRLMKAGVRTNAGGDFEFSDEQRRLLNRPSIFLPRAASRLTLAVTAVKVERLQAITEADAIAEGIERSPHGNGDQWMNYPAGSSAAGWLDPRDSFRTLWNSINGAGAWDANPWVVALTFTVHRANVDTLPRPAKEA